MFGTAILQYKILEKLGEGGMGVVYKAYDSKLEREVAIKFLPAHQAALEEWKKRLIQEAKSASALNHPNVCIIYSFEEYNNKETGIDEHFIVMEYIKGTTLREKNKEGPHKISEVLSYAIQIAEALNEAHSKGIAHLDIKSDNIMINSLNQVKVMDFGLAGLRIPADKSSTDGSTFGTVSYMSPEQALGKPAGFMSDIWSFGIVLYEMLTGRLPFSYDYEAAIIYAVINEEPVHPSMLRDDISYDLEKLIMTCLQKDEELRYQDTRVIISELIRIKEDLDSTDVKNHLEKAHSANGKKDTEQKQVTIVFMKFLEYNELIEKIGHEEVMAVLQNCYKEISGITQKYGGTIKNISSENIVLLFGLPDTIENSSQKALLASVEISESINRLSKELNVPVNLTVSTGINTGMVIAGGISSGSGIDYTVIGDTVEIASKICGLNLYGQILIGEGAFKYLKNLYTFEQVQSFSLRGKRDPVKVFKLKSVKEKAEGNKKDSGRLIHSEMVGRTNELDKLEYLLHKAINGEGSIINIIADAGIGKSRLIEEFKKKDIIKRINLFEGKALSTGRNISFHPIIEILRHWAQINETDNETQGFSKLENSLQRIFGTEANEIIPFIATLMGFSLSSEHAKRIKEVSGDSLNKLIQKSVRDLILKGSQIKPIVFIIEDLHWADLSSIDLLQSIFRLAEKNQVLFITTLRPNFQETGNRFISTIRDRYSGFYTEIKLEPLSNEGCQVLLRNLLRTDKIPAKLKNSISKITEGNPFFIEEVIRSLIDENIIEIKSGNFYVSDNIDQIVIPGTIKDVLLSRIDKLDESARILLKIASVIGRHFLENILKKVTGNIDNIDTRIKYLIKLELIEKNDNSTEPEYSFKHALVQEAVYETLLSKNKQELHLKVAYAIEELYCERIHDFYEILAQHYNKANDKEKAEEYLLKAGERTLKTAASYEALNFFQEALKLYMQKYGDAADKDKIFMIEKNIGLSFYNRGYFKESVEHFNKALEAAGVRTTRSNFNEISRFILNFIKILKRLYSSSGSKKNPSEKDYILFDILFKLVIAYANSNGKKMFYELLNLIRVKTDFNLNGEDGFITYSIAGSLFCFSGLSFSLGKKFIDKANSHARLYGIDMIYQNGYDETLCNCLMGNWKDFKEINENLLDAKIRAGELTYVTYQICWALYIVISRGEFEYAEYLLNKGDEISEIYDFDYCKLYTLSLKADYNLYCRNLYKAIDYYNESIELAKKLSLNTWLIGLAGKKAKALILLNEPEAAQESIEIAESAIPANESLAPILLSYLSAYKLLYLVNLYQKSIKESQSKKINISKLEKDIKKNIRNAEKLSNKVAEIKPEVDRFIGIYYSIRNKHKETIRYFKQSIDYAKHLGALPELGRTYLETAKFLMKTPEKFENLSAADFFNEAENIFIRLNLKWDLDELNRLKTPQAQKLFS